MTMRGRLPILEREEGKVENQTIGLISSSLRQSL
jgi:hypothetical protein